MLVLLADAASIFLACAAALRGGRDPTRLAPASTEEDLVGWGGSIRRDGAATQWRRAVLRSNTAAARNQCGPSGRTAGARTARRRPRRGSTAAGEQCTGLGGPQAVTALAVCPPCHAAGGAALRSQLEDAAPGAGPRADAGVGPAAALSSAASRLRCRWKLGGAGGTCFGSGQEGDTTARRVGRALTLVEPAGRLPVRRRRRCWCPRPRRTSAYQGRPCA